MGVLEMVLLIAGAVIFIVSFVLPAAREELPPQTQQMAREEIQKLVSQEMNEAKGRVEDLVEETADAALEKTERSLEKLSNEKIMAVSDYSDTVIQQIHKNHEEVMFLYDMLNDKHTSLKKAVSQVNQTVGQINEMAKNVKDSRRDAEAAVSSWKQIQLETMDWQQQDAGIKRILRMQQDAAPKEAPLDDAADGGFAFYAGQDSDSAETADGSDGQPFGSAVPWGPGELGADEAVPGWMEVSQPSPEEKPSPRGTAVPGGTAAVPGMDVASGNSNDRILSLYRQGKTTVAIAKELGLGVGEVKLVIDLYKSHL